jgi:hypothetical protein
MCRTVIQCFMTLMNYGVRSGGGIADILPKISFSNKEFFVQRFFYDIFFHILIVWVMGNLFFGIIVDTFADLRDTNTRVENDKANVCFICQLDRDSSLQKNIDFNEHVENDHFLWSYVNFLTYLHTNNPSNFKALESHVWTCISQNDTSWIPIDNANEYQEANKL